MRIIGAILVEKNKELFIRVITRNDDSQSEIVEIRAGDLDSFLKRAKV